MYNALRYITSGFGILLAMVVVAVPQPSLAQISNGGGQVPEQTSSATVAPENTLLDATLTGPQESEIEIECRADFENSGIGDYSCQMFETPEEKEACKKDIVEKCIQDKQAALIEAQSIKRDYRPYVPAGLSNLNKLGVTNITVGISRLISTFVGVIGSVALAMFVYGGFLWMTSRGNGDQTAKAAKIMVWSALGVIVILSSYAIVDFLFSTFG